jgi:hypothetical protein
MRGKFLKVVDN